MQGPCLSIIYLVCEGRFMTNSKLPFHTPKPAFTLATAACSLCPILGDVVSCDICLSLYSFVGLSLRSIVSANGVIRLFIWLVNVLHVYICSIPLFVWWTLTASTSWLLCLPFSFTLLAMAQIRKCSQVNACPHTGSLLPPSMYAMRNSAASRCSKLS